MRHYWRRRAFASHSDPARLAHVVRDLLTASGVDVEIDADTHPAELLAAARQTLLPALVDATPSPHISAWIAARRAKGAAGADTADAVPRLNSIRLEDAGAEFILLLYCNTRRMGDHYHGWHYEWLEPRGPEQLADLILE